MKMSCNGCRILRKGCNQNCILRPCLEWIPAPESQSNATLFLAKFHGRAGLLNLISAGPPRLRPAIFKSLLYDACGRIMNPVYGSVGLMWTGNWTQCESAVEAVLNGSPIMQLPFDDDDQHDGYAPHPVMPLEGGDIRHISAGQQSQSTRRVQTRNRSRKSRNGESDGDLTHDAETSQMERGSAIKLELTLGNNPNVE